MVEKLTIHSRCRQTKVSLPSKIENQVSTMSQNFNILFKSIISHGKMIECGICTKDHRSSQIDHPLPERQTNRQRQEEGVKRERGEKCYLLLGERDASVTRTTVLGGCSFKATKRDASSMQRKCHKDLTQSPQETWGAVGLFHPKL